MSDKSGKILFLTPMNPMGIGGGCFATHAYLRAISDLCDGHVDIMLADSWREKWDNCIRIDKFFKAFPMTFYQYALSLFTFEIQRYSSVAERILKKHPEEYSYIVANGSSISGKICKTAKKTGVKLVTIHHNYEPEYFAANSKGLQKQLYLPIVRKLERKAYLESDINMFLTEQDMIRFNDSYGYNKKINEIIGVFEYKDYAQPKILQKRNNYLTFVITGSLCTMQGIDGIVYFFEELYRYLPERCKVIIAGRNPSEQIKRLCADYSNVELIPNPTDMSEVISSGDVYICPTRVGGGLKLRVMDGLKLGLPVITHECSARGYDAFYGTAYFESFKDSESFGISIKRLVEQLPNIRRSDVIERYMNSFSYESGLERMKNILCK